MGKAKALISGLIERQGCFPRSRSPLDPCGLSSSAKLTASGSEPELSLTPPIAWYHKMSYLAEGLRMQALMLLQVKWRLGGSCMPMEAA